MNRFLKIDETGELNTIFPVPRDKIKNINCHKFVLYMIGEISWEEMVSDSHVRKEAGLDFTFEEKARNISNIDFTPVENIKSLYSLANENCEPGKMYAGQILDAMTKEMAHSFIIEKVDNKYLCTQKQGFKYPFTIQELGTLLDFVNKDGVKSYANQMWRFVPIKAKK